jgi:hypothetical protein
MGFFRKRKPVVQLSGLVASPDGLYDGSFVRACVLWWNHEVENLRGMESAGYRRFSSYELRRLSAVVQPENRAVFETIAGVGNPLQSVRSDRVPFASLVQASGLRSG